MTDDLGATGVIAKGTIINHQYRVQGLLGEGGTGAVYRCITLHEPASRTVALKFLLAKANAVDLTRFARERDTMAGVKHLNVLELIDFGAYNQTTPYLVLEYIDGGSLGSYLEERRRAGKGGMPLPEAAWILFQAIAGLRAGRTVHRDLKPENLLLTRRRSTNEVEFKVGFIDDATVVKVADWGLAMEISPVGDRLTKSQDVFGTPLYMSPEQCRGSKNLTPHSDLYALGVILFEMLVGEPPFDGKDPYEIIKAHCELLPSFPPSIPPEIKPLLASLLAKNVSDRPRSMLAVQDQLRPLLALPPHWQYAAADLDSSPLPAENPSLLGRFSKSLRRLFVPSQEAKI